MKKQTVRLKESQLTNIIKEIINEELCLKGLDIYAKFYSEIYPILKKYQEDINSENIYFIQKAFEQALNRVINGDGITPEMIMNHIKKKETVK